MRARKYIQRIDGEGWEQKSGEIFRLACCDCGLIHDMVLYHPKGGNIGIAAERNNRATGQRRRAWKNKGVRNGRNIK